MTRPAVSVVVPFFDAARHLAETLESVRAQSFTDWELLLVDDGSSDGGTAIAAAASRRDPRIRLLSHRHGAHLGAFASRLLGARRARASVLALLDADDVWEPRYLARHLSRWRRVSRRGAALSYGPARYWFPEGGGDFVHAMPARKAALFDKGELLRSFLETGYVTVPRTSCSLIRRDALLALAAFAPAARRLPRFEDQFLMWGLAARWPVAAHPGAWVRYRQRGPLEARPERYFLETLRDERGFLPVIRRYLERHQPGHPLLGAGGIDARLAALRLLRRAGDRLPRRASS